MRYVAGFILRGANTSDVPRPAALVTANPLTKEIGDWRRWLLKPEDDATLETLRRCGRTGRRN